MKIPDYLGKTIDCSCGRTHTVEINAVEISAGALKKVSAMIHKEGFRKPFIIADCNTHRTAGQELQDLLNKAETPFSSYVFDEHELVPNEDTLGRLLINYDPSCDFVIAVGAGTINDISRFLSHRLQVPYFVVATAPSMDGYASTVAPLIKNNLKTTFECHMPRAIIADLDIISNAPQEMIAAGFSDVVGKYTCLADWKLSAIINGEYYCERVVEMTRQSLEQTISLREGIAQADQNAIGGLMEALVLAGISMSYVGNSRPASGSEHHLSHFWEMRFLFEDKPAVLHGTKVGIATVLVAQLYQSLREENLDSDMIGTVVPPSTATWVEEIHKVFLEATPEVILLEEQTQKNSVIGWQERISAISQRWPAIQRVLHAVPPPEEVVDLINAVGGTVNPVDVGISQQLVQDGILYAKEVRPRYTILQLLWDLNLLSDYSTKAINEQSFVS